MFTTSACLKLSNFLNVKVPSTAAHDERAETIFGKDAQGHSDAHLHERIDCLLAEIQLRAFKPQTTLIYAIGAGITAAAATRLALQLTLVKRLKIYSFQLQDMDALYFYFLSPPVSGLGNLRAWRLPWK